MSEYSKKTEEYIEVIFQIERRKGYARVTDISALLKVQPPSVTEMIQKLANKNLVKYEKYHRVTLTEKGREIAERLHERHRVLKEFLVLVGVNEEIADKDACEMEHVLHPETLEKLTKFVEFIRKAPKSPKWLKHFRYFLEKGEHPPCES